MNHLSKFIKEYILLMRFGFGMFLDTLFSREVNEPVSSEEASDSLVPLSSYQDLKEFLISTIALYEPAVFSSDNSLKSCYVYGDINETIKVVDTTLKGLMLDERIDFEDLTKQRSADFIRNVFVTKDGQFPDVKESIQKLRWLTLRLIEGYNLRKLDTSLGLFTLSNLSTTEFILKDIDSFFTELFDEYRNRKRQPRHNEVDV